MIPGSWKMRPQAIVNDGIHCCFDLSDSGSHLLSARVGGKSTWYKLPAGVYSFLPVPFLFSSIRERWLISGGVFFPADEQQSVAERQIPSVRSDGGD